MATKTKDYAAEYVKQNAKDLKTLEAFIKKLPTFDGFTGEWIDTSYSYNTKSKEYLLTNKKEEVKFTFHPGGDGTTSFNTARGWLTYDRRGVESSFYWMPLWEKAEKPDIKIIIAEQLERIAKSRDFSKTALKVPEVGASISPAMLETLKATFKNAGYHSFYPSGFGTGYTVSTKPLRYGKKASSALMDFFGVAPLYIATFDAD